MAKKVSIKAKENAVEIIVDGNEINDVISYRLEEVPDAVTLTLKIAVIGTIEAQIE